MKENAARPGCKRSLGGKLRGVKRPACNSMADRRVSKLRAGSSQAMPQTCRIGRGDRRVPTDRLRTKLRATSQGSDRGSDQLQPPDLGCPAGEATNSNPPDGCSTAGVISSDHQAGCPAEEGLITPTAGRVQGRRALHSNPLDWAEEEGLNHSNHRPVLRAEGFITPHWQLPSWATFSVHPGLRERPPGF